jgi:phosphoglycolate phosphatase
MHAPFTLLCVKHRTLIFDLDGTISDPSVGISRCINFALESFGYKAVTSDEVRQMIGPPLAEIFEHFLGALPEGRMIELIDRYRERYADVGFAENIIYPRIPKSLAALATSGYRMGVCTSKRADYAVKIVDMFELGSYFEFVDGGDVHIKKFMQLERLVCGGIDAASAVMIGDRAVDIEAAKINGIGSIGVSWGFGDIDELENARPDHVVHAPQELLELYL